MNERIFEAVKKIVNDMGDREFTADTVVQKLKEAGHSTYVGSTRSIGFMLKLIAGKNGKGIWRKKDD